MQPHSGERRLRRIGGDREKPRPGLGVLFLLFLMAAMLLAGGVLTYRMLFAGGPSEDPVTVTIEEGETLSSAAAKLKEAGVVGAAAVFEIQARLQGLEREIKPGEYRLDPGDSNREILATITSADAASEGEVVIPEGLTLEQTARRVAEQSGVSEAEFLRAARRTDYGYEFLEGARNTEGFLFPKQYEFPEKTGAPEMVDRMLQQYLAETRGLDFRRAPHDSDTQREPELTEYEVVTVASLIEREAAEARERPIIASVIYNRLRRDMPLQIDATVQYALDKPKERLSLRDLKVDSPYNTYEREGLPPGPIASPGLDSIKAALNPADTDYLYYVLDRDDESHTFTESYEAFLRAKKRAGR